ncbi:MAG: hypothetical protein ACI4HI_18090 [Lachnospiraceae bacterium]
MKKKNLMAGLTAMAAVAIVSVGGTLAYLTQQTETVTNVFSSDQHLKGKIEEKFDKEHASSYIPGQAIQKEVKLVLKEGSASAYGALKVTVIGPDGTQIPFREFEEKYGKLQVNDGGTLKDGYNTKDWWEAETEGDERFFLYGPEEHALTTLEAEEKDKTTETLFDAVKINTMIKEVVNKKYKSGAVYEQTTPGNYTKVEDWENIEVGSETKYYQKVGDQWVEIEDMDVYPNFDVVVKGYLVQAQNITPDEAVTELAKEAGVTLKK